MLGHRTLNVEDYLTILKRRWWLVALPLLTFPFIALAISYTVTPQYLSKSLVLIESPKVGENYVKPVINSDLDSRLASMREQILSRSRLQPIIERYNLYAGKGINMDDRIDMARKNVDIQPITSEIAHSGGLPGFFISFKAGDAHTAQLVCGEIESLFLGENLRSRAASAEGTTEFLKSQLDDAKRTLDEQDGKLAAFERQYMGRLPGEESPNMSMLSTLNTQLQTATQQLNSMEQNRALQESLLSQQAASLPMPMPSSGGAVSRDSAAVSAQVAQNQQTELQNLLTLEADLTTHYTPDHPDVIAVHKKIADLRKQIAATPKPVPGAISASSAGDSPQVQALRAQIHATDIGIQNKRKEIAGYQGQIGTYESRIQSSPLVEQQYKEITRDNQTAHAFYDQLLAKMNDSKMATDLEKRQQGEQFRIMDEPNLPDAPFSPKRVVYGVGGAVLGIALGLGLIALLEYKDTTLKSERDVWAFTKLPTLAVIAYSGELQVPEKAGFVRRLFSRKRRKETLAQAAG